MNVYRNLTDLPIFKNAVVTIGSFDGVHHGHQRIIHKINQLAREIGGESVIVTFHPHPRQIIYPRDSSLHLLTDIEEKILLFEKYGVDNVVVVPFTVEFSQMSADEYIERFLLGKFKPRYVVIGYDHRFGLNRQGDINYLKWYGKKANFEVVEIEKQMVDDLTVSSTKIRQSIQNGDVQEAARWLGHYFSIRGEVVEGQKIGNKMGFPTANLRVKDQAKLVPPDGIYAAYAIHNKKRYRAMLYIGNRPTLKKYPHQTIEVNLFDFDLDIYGETLQVELVDFLRKDITFENLEDLREELKKDKIRTFNILETAAKEEQKLSTRAIPAACIVILNFNGKHFLKQFLPSVLGTSYRQIRVCVADNASTDDSVEFLKMYYPNVQLIELEKNFGFAEGYNQALSKIDDEVEYFVLLNSDVEVTPGWLDPVIECLENDRDVAACQPKILAYNEKEKFEYAGAAGGWMDRLGYPFCRGRVLNLTEKDEGQYDDSAEIFWASGAAMIIRSKLFKSIGGFDKDYFAHMEEIDLCWRLKKAGFKIMVCPQSVVYHFGGGTLNYNTPRKAYLNFRNSLFTLFKNEKKRNLLWLLPVRLVLDGLAALLFLTEGKTDHIAAILRAHFRFYLSIPFLLEKRQRNARYILRNRISKKWNTKGIFRGSMVWSFYMLNKKTFQKIVEK